MYFRRSKFLDVLAIVMDIVLVPSTGRVDTYTE